jgi:LysR family transcriptional regulator, mexEF-oprN operon transcriptional activator
MMIDDTILRRIDLNLLLAFSVLMRERNVSRAAEKLLVGQPGLSAALRRLRDALGDELFVRVGRGLQPTPRALAIAPAVEDALGAIERAIRPPAAFDPASSDAEFRIGMCDNLETSFFGALAAALRAKAPRARLASRASDCRNAPNLLDAGEIDVGLSVHGEANSWHVKQPLFEQPFICMFDPQQLPLRAPLTLEAYCAQAHVVVSFDGSNSGDVDDALRAAGRERQVIATVPRFSALPSLLRAVPGIATIPESIGCCLAQLHGLALAQPPLAIPSAPVSLLYRRTDRADSRAAWFRELVIDTVRASLAATGSHCQVEQMAAAKAA